MSKKPTTAAVPVVAELLPPGNATLRALIAIILPLVALVIVGVLTGSFGWKPDEVPGGGFEPAAAPALAVLGGFGLLLGIVWYGKRRLGLRGGRPLFAGIGFAVLAWVAVLIARFLPTWPSVSFRPDGQAVVEITLLLETIAIRSDGAGRAYFYFLAFEAFATQIWAFGLVFRAVADWRGPLTAAVTSGILWGTVGFLFFYESFALTLTTLLYFWVWGVLYGIIRLRTGSLIGMVIVQSLQSFTAWYVFQPPHFIEVDQLAIVYFAAIVLFAVIIWRLWPRRPEDFRV